MHIRRITLHPDQYPTADHYPFDQPIFRETRALDLTTPVTFFTGENGTGKSTLLEAVAQRCGIHIWRDTARPPLEVNSYADALQYYLQVTWSNGKVPGAFFSSDNFRHFTFNVDQWAAADRQVLDYFGGRSLVSQSHGQSIMSYFQSRYQKEGVYLMDEPETALSPRSQLALVRLLRDTAQSGYAQFVIATHSPILLACPDALIYSFDRIPVAPISYVKTPLYRIYREFMEDPERYLEREEEEAS